MSACAACTREVDGLIRNATTPIGRHAERLLMDVRALVHCGVLSHEQSQPMLDRLNVIFEECGKLETTCCDIDARGLRVWAGVKG